MKFYAACLASYNNGILHGAWVDASSDAESMQDDINAMLRASRMPYAEEWAIHDYDEELPNFGEYPALKTIADFVELCEEFGETGYGLEPDDIAKIVDEFGDIQQAANNLRDNFCGVFETFRDYAYESADDMIACHDGAEFLKCYFDYDAFARDLQHDMTVVDVSAGVAVFHN